MKDRTINKRKLSNHVLREQLKPAWSLCCRNSPILLESNTRTWLTTCVYKRLSPNVLSK